MRKRLVILGIILFVCLPSSAQVDTTAVIAGWNLKGFTPIPDDRIGRLAQAIVDIDAEVVALSEVNPDGAVDKLILELSRLGAGYQGQLLDQTANLNVAILHKAGVFVGNVSLVDGSDDGNSDLRKALTADVRVGQFDFKILVLHLKSGRSGSSRATRTRQNEVLADFIALATAGDEKDVLVLGDYNMIPGQDAANFAAMSPSGFLRFISSEDLTGQFTHIGSGGTPGNLLDGYGISTFHTQEYIEGSLAILPLQRILGISLADYESDYSDHLPLVARFRITVDDD